MNKTTKLIELAAAMGMSEVEFRTILPSLFVLGFPLSVSDDESFETVALLDWVVKQQDIHLAITSMLAEKLTGPH